TGPQRPADRRREPERPDSDLEQAIERGGPCMAVRFPPEQPGAEAEAAHVGRDDGRDGLDGGPEGLVQDPNPEELVHETRGPGEEKQQAVRARRVRTHAAGASLERDLLPAAG